MSNILPSIPALHDPELVVEGVYHADITSPYGRWEPKTRFRDYEGLRHRERMLAHMVLACRSSLFAVRISELRAAPSRIKSGSVGERHVLTLRCERTDQSAAVITRGWTTGDTLPRATILARPD